MQKSETRRFLEEQFAQYEKERRERASAEFISSPEKTEPADEYLQAPSVYEEEVAEIFKTLPFVVRRYLHKREREIENLCSKCRQELQLEHFLAEKFKTKGCLHGFKTAKDWIEKLIFAEEMLEASPKDTLCYLAKAYGVDFVNKEERDCLDLVSQIEELRFSLACLQSRFEEREKDFAAKTAAAEAAKKAKAAGFSPRGKALVADDFKNLTTRQILERKFAELED